MLNKLKELRALNAFAKKQSVGMQRKLMLYWVSMILVVFAAVILLLSIAGAFSQNDEQLHPGRSPGSPDRPEFESLQRTEP